jgi:hypothetical protein
MRPKVIGVGLNKTGTKTLQRALSILGYRTLASCDRGLLAAYRQGDPEPALASVRDNELCEDWPYPLMYREIFDRFGMGARYVLTMRSSAGVWLDSLKAHSLRTDPEVHCRALAYGFAYPHGAESEHLAIYERHQREVAAFFSQRRASSALLRVCWEDGDGWEALCPFLGLPVPDAPFPHENRSFTPDQEMERRNTALIAVQREALSTAAPAASTG